MSRDELAETTNGPARGMSSPARAARKPPTSSDDARVVDLTTAVVDKDLNNQTTTAPAGPTDAAPDCRLEDGCHRLGAAPGSGVLGVRLVKGAGIIRGKGAQ